MDLGIKGKKAIICASSKGLGKACAISLSREGVIVIINGRNEATVTSTVQEIQALTSNDYQSEESRFLFCYPAKVRQLVHNKPWI